MSREYDKTHYKKLREKILSMDNACYYCGQEANTIDHLIPISKGGISSEDNCVPCCHRCNSGKRDRIAPGSFLMELEMIIVQKILNYGWEQLDMVKEPQI